MELIPVKENSSGQVVVSGRELHEFLGIKTQYTKWFERMVEYGFDENQDYLLDSQKRLTNNPKNPTTEITDHALTISMAKEISMIQRNEKGKQARQYFIKVEEAWNSPEMIMKRALQIADKKIISLEEKIRTDKPKTIFADAVAASHTSILVGELAKMLKQNGIDMGANRLFQWLRTNGFLIKRKGTDWNMPTQYSMDLKLFEIKETNVQHADGHITISKTPKVTGKGQQYFINKFLNEEELKIIN
ncbi:phage antirepressor KilAC domain-containing protein [Vagococcus fluvialis]|uniref:phage antirepressor KilAC domain-containing protein n=1 Tax=Vagococcus fluvialis TaxID=2738 RepID=UPI001D09C776|nr:phage antirepressor KilAC domain-containing protein [Vagococcus fluvialis]UDM70174.1 phage antirepressor KilAC domain-containing protein [Vagococcus fluvialis]UDM77593.1 phage antirepressor KilAC domain-containing protein [Vagococcus fluvialis]UDM81863.1 phage antirepressor KilAC domain-containing protein [Vagococcus fluvialis]